MIKLIGFDLDDTLLNNKKIISEPDKEAIKQVIDKCIKIVFVSGRPFGENIINYYNDIGYCSSINDVYYCGYNGEAIYDVKTKECIYQDMLTEDEIGMIDGIFSNIKDVARYVHCDGLIYTTSINEYVKIEEVNNIPIKISDLSSIKKAHKYMVAGNEEIIKKIYESLSPCLLSKFTVTISMPCFIEIFNKKCNKYIGLKKVASLYGVDDNEIMAIGDSMNDYEMVKNSYIGIAMGNGNQKVKEVSKYITSSNEEFGIANALKKFILGEDI